MAGEWGRGRESLEGCTWRYVLKEKDHIPAKVFKVIEDAIERELWYLFTQPRNMIMIIIIIRGLGSEWEWSSDH